MTKPVPEFISYLHIQIGKYRIVSLRGFWLAVDANNGRFVYGGPENLGGVEGTDLMEVLRVVVKEYPRLAAKRAALSPSTFVRENANKRTPSTNKQQKHTKRREE